MKRHTQRARTMRDHEHMKVSPERYTTRPGLRVCQVRVSCLQTVPSKYPLPRLKGKRTPHLHNSDSQGSHARLPLLPPHTPVPHPRGTSTSSARPAQLTYRMYSECHTNPGKYKSDTKRMSTSSPKTNAQRREKWQQHISRSPPRETTPKTGETQTFTPKKETEHEYLKTRN